MRGPRKHGGRWPGRLGALLVVVAGCLTPGLARAGYTHYFTWHIAPADARIEACLADMKRVAGARADLVEVRTATATTLSLNGRGEGAHEDFVFPGQVADTAKGASSFNFCKTAGKAYDEVVTACLLVARDCFTPAELAIASDGGWAEWSAGRALYARVLGKAPKRPFVEAHVQGPHEYEPGDEGAWAGPMGGFGGLGWLSSLIPLALLMLMFRGGSASGQTWSSYYLFWFVAPLVIAIVSAQPLVLLVIGVALVARRWLPDPYVLLKQARRVRALRLDVELNAANVTARRDLARLYLERRRPLRALPLLDQALQKDPDSDELRFLRGRCLLQARRWEAALEDLVTVANRSPKFSYGDAFLRAGDALLGLGRWDDAEEALTRFVKINGSGVEGWYKLAQVRDRRADTAGATAARGEARDAYRLLPAFQRRHAFPWYLRLRLGLRLRA